MGWYYGFKPYVPVARRRAQAAKYAAKIAKKERRQLSPVVIEGRAVATSFWGEAWCENLERYSDFASRLPRGRTYVRNGSVIDLQIARGEVKALVSGSEIYHVHIKIKTLGKSLWSRIKNDCGRSIASLIDLLQGRFDQGIMQRLTQRDGGLFPPPPEIEMNCSCPDWADMCKHVAAVLYGVGARLDASPELLFTLRNVDHLELVEQAVDAKNLDQSLSTTADQALAGSDLGALFGIELDQRPARRSAVKTTREHRPPPKGPSRAGTKKAAAAATVELAPTEAKKANRRRSRNRNVVAPR
jgi:uncharacterized Zn finger protein